MRRLTVALSAGLMAFGLAGCQKDNASGIAEKLDKIDKRLDNIEALVKAGGGGGARGAARPPRKQRPRPEPNATYSVPVAGQPSVGPDDAMVTIVKGFEFACPYCLRVAPTLDQLRKEYGDKLRIVYKDFIVHPSVATMPSLAACAAHKQGKYKEMYNGIWEKGFKANRNLSEDNMKTIAKGIGLDMGKFEKDLKGPECQKSIRQNQAELSKVGTSGTPAFYINGRFLSGARPADQFKAIIDQEIKKAEQRIKAGTPAAKYYDEWVVKKGKKTL